MLGLSLNSNLMSWCLIGSYVLAKEISALRFFTCSIPKSDGIMWEGFTSCNGNSGDSYSDNTDFEILLAFRLLLLPPDYHNSIS